MPSVERRKWPRVALEREIVVYAAGQRLSCRAVDISAGGVCLLPPVQGDPGLLLRLNIGFSNGHTVAVDGVVVREGKVGSRYAWGVRFHRVAPRIQQQLAEQVAAEERYSAGEHVPTRRVSTGRGHPRVRGGGGGEEGAARPAPAREAIPQRRPLSGEVATDDDDEAQGAGEYKQIGRGTRERVRLRDLPTPDGDASAPAFPSRSPTGPAYPRVTQKQRSQSRWEIDLMAADDGGEEAPSSAAPGVRPMRPLVPTGPHRAVDGQRADERPPRPTPGRISPRAETGPGYAAVRGRRSEPGRRGEAPKTGPASPATSRERRGSQRDPELERAIGDELESLLRAAMDKLDEEG